MQELASCLASLGIGLLLGIIGAGGSIVTIPVFVYILRIDPLSSGVYSMFVVGMSSLAGGIQSVLNKLVDARAAVSFGVPSVIGVFVARELVFPSIPSQLFSLGSFMLSKNILFMLCLALLMFFGGLRMLKPVSKERQPVRNSNHSIVLLLLQGFSVGLVTGLLGIGGGFLIVPALYFLAMLPMKRAIGTALVIIAFNSSLSFVASYRSVNLDWALLLKFSLGATAGIFIGAKLAGKIAGERLRKIFGWFILAAAVYVVHKQFSHGG